MSRQRKSARYWFEQQKEFINILFHDSKERNGYFVRCRFGIDIEQLWSRRPYDLIKNSRYEFSEDTYISLNSFKTKNRCSHHIFNINAIYFDLDFHDAARQHELPHRIENTLLALKKASDAGSLPYPTMITATGRGIGLYYVLDRSIANTNNTVRQYRLWEYIYKGLAFKIDKLLLDFNRPVLNLDYKVVSDKSRICRLPGTLNTKCGKLCALYKVNKKGGLPVYYSLKQLRSFIPDKISSGSSTFNRNIPRNHYNTACLNNMLLMRMDKLKRARDVLSCEGSRELLCFYFYNTAVQLYDTVTSSILLNEYNNLFKSPIAEKELINIIKSVSKAADKNGRIKGYYRIKDSTILNNLQLSQMKQHKELSQEQIDYIGFCSDARKVRREKQKAETKRQREERNQLVAMFIKEHPDISYKDISVHFAVSVRTINNIVKTYGIFRYKKKQKSSAGTYGKADSICNYLLFLKPRYCAAVFSSSIFSNNPLNISVARMPKMQKNAPVSLCCDVLIPQDHEQTENRLKSKTEPRLECKYSVMFLTTYLNLCFADDNCLGFEQLRFLNSS